MAVFDVLDRYGDGTLQMDEVIGFGVKILSFYLQCLKIGAKVVLETFLVEAGKDAIAGAWKAMKLTEVSKGDCAQLAMMAPMMMMGGMLGGDDCE